MGKSSLLIFFFLGLLVITEGRGNAIGIWCFGKISTKDWNERRENGALLILLITLFIHICFERAISLRIFLEQAITHPQLPPATISSLYIPVQARRYTTKLIYTVVTVSRRTSMVFDKKISTDQPVLG